MKPARKKASFDPSRASEILSALHEECENMIRLIRRFEMKRLPKRTRQDLLGELDAAITELHVRTKGLDEFILELD